MVNFKIHLSRSGIFIFLTKKEPMTTLSGFPLYISMVEKNDVADLFRSKDNLHLFSTISEEKSFYRYTPGKWSIKELVGHIIDHERIMTYRALRFSRIDPTELPGYDQDAYVTNAYSDKRAFADIIAEYNNVRQATISLINTFSPEQLNLKGFAWKYEISVEDLLKATIGHEIHHINILKQRYLK